MANIVVLGSGLVGSTIACDLSTQHKVTSVDYNPEAFQRVGRFPQINTVEADLTDQNQLSKQISGADLVIGAVPGHMGFQTMKTVIESGKNMVDISFMPEDFLSLCEFARKKNVTVIADCGVAPGMGNIILAHHDRLMKINSYECLVGGLPLVREWPYEYKAVFSPIDVIEEYTRPARFVQNFELIIKEALSDPELIEFKHIGTLESWNSDGLRSLIQTMEHIPNMIEKTLRYPGCIEYLRVLRESGFFSYEEIDVKGNKVRPIDVTASLLFPKWELKEGEEDFTVMRIVIEGIEQGEEKKYTYNLLDRYDKESELTSMARTTGYTCTSAANLVLEGRFKHKGVYAPESIGQEAGALEYILSYLGDRKVYYTKE